MHFLFLGLDTTLRFPIKELFIVEAIHSFDPEASSPSLDKNLLSLYVGERVVILGNFDFLKKKSQVVCLLSLQLIYAQPVHTAIFIHELMSGVETIIRVYIKPILYL